MPASFVLDVSPGEWFNKLHCSRYRYTHIARREWFISWAFDFGARWPRCYDATHHPEGETMCGYCTEGLVVEYLSSGVMRGHNRSIYLQEADFASDIATYGRCATQYQQDIVACRVLDRFITQGHDASIIDRLLVAGTDIVGSFRSRGTHALWPHLADEVIYHDKNQWGAIIADPVVLHTALRTLDDYHDWWIGGNGRTDGLDQDTNDSDVGSDGTSDWQTFCNIFPIVSFSLSLVSKVHVDADVIKKIALEPPHSVPDSLANDLWAQRRALLTCVDRYGLPFVVDNLPRLRYELISYVLLRSDFGSLELNRVKEALLAEEAHEISVMMEAADVVELIDRLVSRVNYFVRFGDN